MSVIVTIIDGNFPDFIDNEVDGYITVKEPDVGKAFGLAIQFFKYGMTVVIEPERDGK